MELQGCVVILFNFMRNCQPFPQWLRHATHPLVTWESFSFSSSLLAFIFFSPSISLPYAASLRDKDWESPVGEQHRSQDLAL